MIQRRQDPRALPGPQTGTVPRHQRELTIFLLVLGVLILAVLLRLLWRAKKVRAQASQDILEGEYSVEPQEEGMLDGSAADFTHKVIRDANIKVD